MFEILLNNNHNNGNNNIINNWISKQSISFDVTNKLMNSKNM